MLSSADLDAIATHAASLNCEARDATLRSGAYANLCAKRVVEVRDQELRSFVARRSIFRIDCVAGFAMLMTSLIYVFPGHLSRDWLVPCTSTVGLLIAASTISVLSAVRTASAEAGDSLAVDQVIVELE